MDAYVAASDPSVSVDPNAARRPQDAAPRVALPGGDWTLWPWSALRGAGLPVDLLVELGAPSCARAAEFLDDRRRGEAEARATGVAAIQQAAIAAGRRRPDDAKALRLLRSAQAPSGPEQAGPAYASVLRWQQAQAACDAAQREFDALFDAASRQCGQALRRMAGRRDLREAVAWQNPHALRNAIDPLAAGAGATRDSKTRRREHVVASYLQRYCAKNDTIGFFGPVGWARLRNDGPALRVRAGEALVTRRNLYFESWCIDALVENFAHRREVLPWIAPYRNCAMHERDGVAYLPMRPPLRLTPAERAVLATSDGTRPAHRVAADVLGDPGLGLRSAAEVYALLEALQVRGLIHWTFELPRQLRPDAALREALSRIADTRLRAPLEAALAQLQACFDRLVETAGDADAVSAGIAELESTFNRLTGREATRSAGAMYAGRTLVYEDCVRDGELEIGPELLADVGRPLSLVLDSARWLGYAVWLSYRKIATSLYASMARSAGAAQVDFVKFWVSIQPYLFDRRDEVAALAQSQFQKRWLRIVQPAAGERRMHFGSDALRAAFSKEFGLGERPRSLSRYHSPDLMFAAKDAEALGRMDYLAVLGELHAGINTLAWPLFVEQHPAPQELFGLIDHDQPHPRLLPVVPKGAYGDLTRLFPSLVSPRDYYLGLQTGPTQADHPRYLPVGQLVVEDDGKELMVRTRDGRVGFELMTALNPVVEVVTAARFKPFEAAAHLPRITIDRLVVCRESWSFALGAAAFAFAPDEAQRYADARAWAVANGLPRFAFVKFPGEDKPVYVDLESPVYVEILSKLVRRATAGEAAGQAAFALIEMLPRIDESWLPGPGGERYTCELRMVAVDGLGAAA
ncbi:lantibiotic dehydratase [Lysobacter enzymogenes]|uniref:lantibiotic dehydratase n=1 Tax=Lysobacter enzymogenes TaxID=69 RepID=UPI00099C2523|nr:lantibiotic dehydratase [Lysobacter enzymogenes]UZW58372.1 lantibiotic dehydratase family protein [Lysobacter enzymogenes]